MQNEKTQFFNEFIQYYLVDMPIPDILEMLETTYDLPENIQMEIVEKATDSLDLAINDIYTSIFDIV